MILRIPDPAHAPPHRTTEHAEAVGPLAAAPASGLHQAPHVAVAGEALVGAAVAGGAAVEFYAEGAAGGFVGGGARHALGDGGGHADGAGGVVDPGEEGAFEPSGVG